MGFIAFIFYIWTVIKYLSLAIYSYLSVLYYLDYHERKMYKLAETFGQQFIYLLPYGYYFYGAWQHYKDGK